MDSQHPSATGKTGPSKLAMPVRSRSPAPKATSSFVAPSPLEPVRVPHPCPERRRIAPLTGTRSAEWSVIRAHANPRVLDGVTSEGDAHRHERSANNPIEADRSRLKSAQTVSAGQASMRNLRRDDYGTATGEPAWAGVRLAFEALTSAV